MRHHKIRARIQPGKLVELLPAQRRIQQITLQHLPLGVVPHVPPEARDDDDRVADAVRDALGEDGLRALLG